MGNCLRSVPPLISDDLSYPSEANLTLKHSSGRVKCRLSPPEVLTALTLKVGSLTLTTSACLLTGMDVLAGVDRGTQEAVFHIAVEDAALVGVFDGHGKDGKKVVEFCSEWFQSYFKQHKEEFRAEARVALVQAFERCDAAVKLEVECNLSGTSALLLYFTEFTLTSACVGEVRAVVGAVPTPGVVSSPRKEARQVPDQFRRALVPARALDAYQVTGESHPEYQEELDRILLAGGRVSRLTTEEYGKAGPYRVWKKDVNLPGLAASRSLCDKMASAIGVVPTPIIRQYSLNPQQDLFLVAATDGLWNVMESYEVVDFVEKFRRSCSKVPSQKPLAAVKPAQTTISHLLGAEARYRWLGIVQNEGVLMDDITCLVLELGGGVASSTPYPSERFDKVPSSQPVSVNDQLSDIPCPRGADALRSSLVPVLEKGSRHSVSRNDANRGSLVQQQTNKH